MQGAKSLPLLKRPIKPNTDASETEQESYKTLIGDCASSLEAQVILLESQLMYFETLASVTLGDLEEPVYPTSQDDKVRMASDTLRDISKNITPEPDPFPKTPQGRPQLRLVH